MNQPVIRKALTFRASSIGDCLMGVYFLSNVHAAYPEAKLGIVIGSRGNMIRDLLAGYPWIEILEVNRRHPLKLARLLYKYADADCVLTQYAGKPGGRFSTPSKIIGRFLAKKGGFIGFADSAPWNNRIYDRVLPIDYNRAPAALERDALNIIGIPVSFSSPSIRAPRDSDICRRLAVRAGAYVLVHLFAGNTSRGLSPEKQKEIVSALVEVLPEAVDILISGGSQDTDLAMHAVGNTRARSIAGCVSLQDMLALIGSATGVVAVDTGVAHMTAQLGTPLVVLSSCLGVHWWTKGQYESSSIVVLRGTPHGEEGHIHGAYPSCLASITNAEVTSAVHRGFTIL